MKVRFLGSILLTLSFCLLSLPLAAAKTNVMLILNGFNFMSDRADVIAKAEKPVRVAQAKQAVYFMDDFDGGALKEHWEVINPDKDAYIVEDGNLLIISGKAGGLSEGTIVNLLRLKKPMPKGDWIMTAKFNVEYQTNKEEFILGLYDDNENFIIGLSLINAFDNQYHGYDGDQLIQATKASKGHQTHFTKELASIYHKKRAELEAWVDSLTRPEYLRLEKKGQIYTVSAKLEKGDWIELEKLAAIGAKGNLIVGFTQLDEVTGESIVKIDWVKIETPELPT